MSAGAPLRVFDVCSGVGAFSLGLEATGGFRTVAFAEVDPAACRVPADPGVVRMVDGAANRLDGARDRVRLSSCRGWRWSPRSSRS